MNNNHPNFRKIPFKHKLTCFGIILLAIFSITMTILAFGGNVAKKTASPLTCLSSLFSCCLLAVPIKHNSKKFFYFLLVCSGISFVSFLIVAAVTYLH